MDLKKQVMLMTFLTAFQFANVNAAQIDDELAIIAAEQQGTDVETFQNEQPKEPEKKIEPPPTTPPPEEVKTPPAEEIQKPAEEIQKPVEEIQKPVEEVQQPVEEIKQPVEEIQKPVEEVQKPVEEIQQPVQEIKQPAVNLPNPILKFTNFENLVAAVKFVPLYIPQKSGYTIISMHTINDKIAEIRYGRRWEPEVVLHVRTYKRQENEELKDISGVQGVKWRIDMTSGATIYIAKINDRSHVAAWSSGDYTFSAYVENLSFAAFHSLVVDELVDLSTHYFVKNAD